VDLWGLKLEANSTDFVRMTRWGDYDGCKAELAELESAVLEVEPAKQA
jgi:hypothetical protein